MNTQEKIIKIGLVKEISGLSTSTIRRLVKDKKFPAPMLIPGTSRKGWSLLQVNQWVDEVKSQPQVKLLAHSKTWRTTKL